MVDSMKLFVYSLREFDERQYFDSWCEKWGVTYSSTTEGPRPDNLGLAAGYDAVSIITTPLDRAMLAALKAGGVRCISTRTVGYDHVDIKAAKELGLTVCNAPYPPNSVANYTIMLMLMCCRKVTHILQRAALQDYSLQGKIGMELSNCTVGIIGTGKIGRTVIARLKGFGCRILAYDLYPSPEVAGLAEYTDLDTLYRESHIISLHMPSTEENFHMINDAALEKMQDGVILINTARGSLIAPDSLIKGLENKKIGAAGLDVIENETNLYYFNLAGVPLDNHELSLLKGFPNVILTPHTAFYTVEAVEHMVKNSIAGCLHALKGEENPFQVV